MKFTQHTKAPWVVCTTTVGGAVVRWHIAGAKHGSAYPICEHVIEQEPDGAEQLANACLIAAAPELLAIAQRWLQWTQGGVQPIAVRIALEADTLAAVEKARVAS